MITFNCPRPDCGKGLIRPDRDAGRTLPCPGCGTPLTVPAPVRRRPRRGLRWLLVVIALLAVAGLLGWRAHEAARPARVRQRLAAELAGRSERWRGLEWQECDPARGSYRLTAYYRASETVYQFEVVGRPGDVIAVRVNPPHWLVYTTYTAGARGEFLYRGDGAAERQLLEVLAEEVAEGLRQADRLARR